jgi:outer membrane protein assembly factor BamB
MRLRRWMVAAVACLGIAVVPSVAIAAVPAWTTYRHDAGRSGIDPDSSSPVTPTQIWQTPALDGAIYAEPLVYGSRVYVVTENDTVYALDAASGGIVWQKHLATPVNAGTLNCGNINPTVGITSTPVIDPATGRIYVVGDTWDGSNASTIAHELWALNLSDGSVGVGPVRVDPAGSSPIDQLQRTSLALDAGKVLIGYGANSGDCGTYNGWLVAVHEDGTSIQTFEVDSQSPGNGGAIWASGNAPAIDGAGNIWIATGNGPETSFGYQESVIKLDPNLNVLDWWAPSDWSSLDHNDTDIGSSMPLLLPGGLVFAIGKSGIGYLLNASSLGHTGGTPVYSQSVCSGSYGGGIYYNGVIYVTCSDGMYALALDTSTKRFTPLSTWIVDPNGVSPPIEAGGLIWSADYNGSTLYGFDPRTGVATFVSAKLNGFEHFMMPSAAGGRLFVANQDAGSAGDHVTAFQIAATPGPSQTTTSVASSSNPAAAGQAVTLTATVSPAPDAGTVAFTDNGATIAGCGAAAVSVATGQAICTTAFAANGSHAIVAGFSGDAYYQASSGALTQGVVSSGSGSAGPAISHLRVKVVHRKLRFSLTLSEPAKLVIVVSKLVPGHFRHHRCRAGGRRGRRCRASLRKASLTHRGQAGYNSFAPAMRALAPGTYAVTVTAIDSASQRSKPVTVVVVVRLARRRR